MLDPVLRSIDLTISEGTTTWIGGANGAGKTSLLRIAAGVTRPDSGTVSIAGLDPARHRRRCQQLIGFVSAGDRGLYARVSVERHVDLGARLALLPAHRRTQVTERAIVAFGLDGLRERRVDRMSLGQRQRVKLALAFLHDPTLVLLDEPLSSLDDSGIADLHAAIVAVLGRGGAVLWSSPPGERSRIESGIELTLAEGRLVEA